MPTIDLIKRGRPLKWQDEILTLLIDEGPFYYQQIVDRLNLDRNVCSRNLEGLVEKNYIKGERNGNKMYYSYMPLGWLKEFIREEVNKSSPYDDPAHVDELFRFLPVFVRKYYDESISEEEAEQQIRRILLDLKEDVIPRKKRDEYAQRFRILLKELKYKTGGIYEQLAYIKQFKDHVKDIEEKFYTSRVR